MSDPGKSDLKKGFIKKLISGDFGLAATYWQYGIITGIILSIILVLLIPEEMNYFNKTLLPFFIGYLIYIAYMVISGVGVFNAALKYNGSKIWPWLAVIMVIVNWICLFFISMLFIWGWGLL